MVAVPRLEIAGRGCGIGMVPEDRKQGGLFLAMDFARNFVATVLGKVSRAGLVSEAAPEALADRFIRELRIARPASTSRPCC